METKVISLKKFNPLLCFILNSNQIYIKDIFKIISIYCYIFKDALYKQISIGDIITPYYRSPYSTVNCYLHFKRGKIVDLIYKSTIFSNKQDPNIIYHSEIKYLCKIKELLQNNCKLQEYIYKTKDIILS